MLLGEVSEWFKEPVLKTGDPARDRGFESHLLRQAPEGLQTSLSELFIQSKVLLIKKCIPFYPEQIK